MSYYKNGYYNNNINKQCYCRDKVIRNNKIYFKDFIRREITSYYKMLYANNEIKSVQEICDELNISSRVLLDYIDDCCEISSDNYSPLTFVIMVSTEFSKKHRFYHIQQEKFGEVIRKRIILNEVRKRNEKLKQKRLVKSKGD